MRFLPLRFGDGDIDGVFETAIVPDVRSREAQEIAELILKRLKLAGGVDALTPKKSIDVAANTERLENSLKVALSAYKGQPDCFIRPRLTKERDSTEDDENLLDEIIDFPVSALILAQPEFGQTCLCHHLRLEAYKKGSIWVYIDAEQTKTRKVLDHIREQLDIFSVEQLDLWDTENSRPECIVIDSWDGDIIDHANMLKCLDSEYPETPILVMVNYVESTFNSEFDFSKLQHKFQVFHLQPLRRARVRELVAKYCAAKDIPAEDGVITKVVRDLAALNIHRTPLNCLTLLRVFEKDQNEEIINRTKLIKTVLFILFTDTDSFTYASSKPEVDDCEYVLGRYCKSLIDSGDTIFERQGFRAELELYCKEKLISVDVNLLIDILESNNILVKVGECLKFKHSYWIYYFAATYMLHDSEFADDILADRRYVNYPEIIEFYTGIDGRRADALKILIRDTNALVERVDDKIGMQKQFNPFEGIVWDPSDQEVEVMRAEVSKKVESSKLPDEIKDRYADETYDSTSPYDQTIRQFLQDYSVTSMLQATKAASRALRNSKYVDSELKKELLTCIISGWASMGRVAFALAPTLALHGSASYDGLGLFLAKGFEGSFQKRLKRILLALPLNVVGFMKDDLSTRNIGPLVDSLLSSRLENLQKHFLVYFLIQERPTGWHQTVFDYMNRLHRNSYYLWDLSGAVDSEFELGFASDEERRGLRQLKDLVAAKHIEGPRKKSPQRLPTGQVINEKNKLPIDKIRAATKGQKT